MPAGPEHDVVALRASAVCVACGIELAEVRLHLDNLSDKEALSDASREVLPRKMLCDREGRLKVKGAGEFGVAERAIPPGGAGVSLYLTQRFEKSLMMRSTSSSEIPDPRVPAFGSAPDAGSFWE